VAITTSSRTPWATSGRISGVGLASATISGREPKARLVRIHQRGAALKNHALDVGDPDVFQRQAQVHHQVQARQRRSARAGRNHLDLLDVLAHDLQAIDEGRRHTDRRAVLVVVEDWDLHAFAQFALDGEALRRLDIFKVDAAEGGFQAGNDLDQLVRVGFIDFDIEDIQAGELLEQHGLAFHHRLGGQRADIAQAQHRGAVGDDAHQIAAGRVAEHVGRIRHDFLTGRRHAGRVRQRQIALVRQLLGRRDRDFAGAPVLVIFKGGFAKVGIHRAATG